MYKCTRKISIALRKGTVRLIDMFGPFTESVVVVTVGILVVLVGWKTGFAQPSDIVWGSITAFTSGFVVYWIARTARRNAILIEITMAYFVHGGFGLLDKLLGRIISGRWQREEIRPGDALFDALKEVCQKADYWKKRRVSEALPVLGAIDKKRTLKLIHILREDWDEKWESDLRRRAVESLATICVGQKGALIDFLRPNEIETILRLRQGDQVFTSMAVIEVLYNWYEAEPEKAAFMLKLVREFSEEEFTLSEASALERLIELLEISRKGNSHKVNKLLEQMINSENLFERISAARNIPLISKSLPESYLAIFQQILNMKGSEYRNVRRPLAKEKNVEIIIRMISIKKYKDVAISLLKNLVLADEDDIIRDTAFDKVEILTNSEPELLKEICNVVIEKEKLVDLHDRAKRVLDELKEQQ